jgi:hypothetical protein
MRAGNSMEILRKPAPGLHHEHPPWKCHHNPVCSRKGSRSTALTSTEFRRHAGKSAPKSLRAYTETTAGKPDPMEPGAPSCSRPPARRDTKSAAPGKPDPGPAHTSPGRSRRASLWAKVRRPARPAASLFAAFSLSVPAPSIVGGCRLFNDP